MATMRFPLLNRLKLLFFSTALVVILLMETGAPGADKKTPIVPLPDKSDKCPVCGMIVYQYPDFVSSVTFQDGYTVFFDGAKDMFKYLFNLRKYAPGRKGENVRHIHVTEYYDMKPIEGRRAFYVIGSDVYGPMGHELIPLKSAPDAHGFMKDHKGKRIVRFGEVTPALIKTLD